MVKQTTTTVPPADVPAQTPAVEKKKRSTKKETVAETPSPVVEAPVAEAPVAEATEKTDVSVELESEIADLLKNLQERALLDARIRANAKAIEKKASRMSKTMDKTNKKKRNAPNKVSGFEKPTGISDELAKFVGVEVGTELARTAVSKKIHEYVKAHNLQNPENRRIINPDSKLKKLLNLKPTDEVSYFNLQKFLKVHFKKSA